MSLSPDGTRIVTGSMTTRRGCGTRRRWATTRPERPHGLADERSFSPDAPASSRAAGTGRRTMWDARNGTALLDLKGHTGCVWSVRA